MIFPSHFLCIRSPRLRRPGFTLIELLIVIAIIVTLLGLILAGGLAMRKAAKRHAQLAAFEQLKDAFTLYRAELGYSVNEAETAGWMVQEGTNTAYSAAAARPLTPMEYFVFKINGVVQASKPLAVMDTHLRVASTSKAAAGYYQQVRIFIPDPDPTNPGAPKIPYTYTTPAAYTLYDPADPGVPAGLVFDHNNTAPLYTLIGPWNPEAWDPANWKTTNVGAFTFKWRPYELDFRRITDPNDPSIAAMGGVPPYLPYSENALFSSPGPDGLWGALANHAADTVDGANDPSGNAKDNLYSNQRRQ